VCTDTLTKRKVCRAFKQVPVDRNIIEKLLEVSQNAPSGSNMQPWEVYVVTAVKLDDLRNKINKAKDEKKRNYGIPFAGEVPDKYLKRRKELLDGLKEYLAEDNLQLGYILNGSLNFFDAPAVAFIYIHKSLFPVRVIDIGSYMVYFMLAAESLELGTCPIGYIRGVSDVIDSYIGISDEYILQLAIAFGYVDENKTVNKFKSSRAPLGDNTRIL
jgi:nitroreductase